MENLYVDITVNIQDNQYNFNSKRTGEVKMRFVLARNLLEHLDGNKIIADQIRAALAEFDNCEVKEEESE